MVLGQPTSLRCTFTRKPYQEVGKVKKNLTSSTNIFQLDSIKWFKGDHRDHEFLRLTRWSTPIRGEFSRKEFPTKGVNIDQNLTRVRSSPSSVISVINHHYYHDHNNRLYNYMFQLELGEEGGNHTLVLPHTELSTTGTYW